MHPVTGLCQGCLRTIDEIAHWSILTDTEKRDVLAQVEARLVQSHHTPTPLTT
jgi:uncharacterized protein